MFSRRKTLKGSQTYSGSCLIENEGFSLYLKNESTRATAIKVTKLSNHQYDMDQIGALSVYLELGHLEVASACCEVNSQHLFESNTLAPNLETAKLGHLRESQSC